MDGSYNPTWNQLFRVLRPGSRIVLYEPSSQLLVTEFARRGFRILIVHENSSFASSSRKALYSLGLQSQLMGAQTIKREKSFQIAKKFYDIILCCGENCLELRTVKPFLNFGGLLVLPGGKAKAISHPDFEEQPSPTKNFRIFRLIP